MTAGRPAIIFCNRLLCLFISYLYFNILFMFLGNHWGQLCRTSRQLSRVGAGTERVYLRFPKFRLVSYRVQKGQQFHGLSRFAIADGRQLFRHFTPLCVFTSSRYK